MRAVTETLKDLQEQPLHMELARKLYIISGEMIHEFLAGPWMLGLVLLALGLATTRPLLVMAGTVIVAGMMAVIFRVHNQC